MQDDQRIMWEGCDSLNRAELQEACAERGMRSVGVSTDTLRKQLEQWIDLSGKRHVPVSLLVLSRCFALEDDDFDANPEKAIAESISALEEDVVNEAVLEVTVATLAASPPAHTLGDPLLRSIACDLASRSPSSPSPAPGGSSSYLFLPCTRRPHSRPKAANP